MWSEIEEPLEQLYAKPFFLRGERVNERIADGGARGTRGKIGGEAPIGAPKICARCTANRPHRLRNSIVIDSVIGRASGGGAN